MINMDKENQRIVAAWKETNDAQGAVVAHWAAGFIKELEAAGFKREEALAIFTSTVRIELAVGGQETKEAPP